MDANSLSSFVSYRVFLYIYNSFKNSRIKILKTNTLTRGDIFFLLNR